MVVKLFEPYTIKGKLPLRNRTILPAIVTRLATENGEVTDDLLERYELYARGGVGMIVTEAVSVKKQKSGPLLRISDDSFVEGLKNPHRKGARGKRRQGRSPADPFSQTLA